MSSVWRSWPFSIGQKGSQKGADISHGAESFLRSFSAYYERPESQNGSFLISFLRLDLAVTGASVQILKIFKTLKIFKIFKIWRSEKSFSMETPHERMVTCLIFHVGTVRYVGILGKSPHAHGAITY